MAIKKTTKTKVSEKTVAQLRKGTMAGNLAKAKGATPEMKEALTRFYGASRVNAAIGKSGPGSVGKPKPMTPTPNSRENRAAPSVGTANDREGRKPAVASPKPSGGPGAKMTGRPRGGPGAKMPKTSASSSAKPTATKGTGNTNRVNKPLVNLPGAFGNAQTKLNTKAAANKALLDKQKKTAQANAKKNGMK
jgi:hypothetical protein